MLVIPDMNRALVEGATHPQALGAIVAELGWEKEAQLQAGLNFAMGAIAAKDTLSWDEPFETITFPGSDARVRTRLGLDDMKLTLARPTTSPFGQTIRTLNLPMHMVRAARIELVEMPETLAVEKTEGGFALPTLGLHYTRIGLNLSD
jgi:CRISPR-associated endonuclease/helicase Cas3